MRAHFSWVFLLMLTGCSTCNKTESAFAPESLEGQTLHCTISQRSGSFADLPENYGFDATFLNENKFKTHDSEKAQESEGAYTYQKLDDNSASLTLTDNSPLHQQEKLQVSLNFTSAKIAMYSAKVVLGLGGEHNGSCELR